jgi:hypothetical protein
MFTKLTTALVLLIAAVSASHAAVITLVNTIPSGNLFLQPPVLTGAAPVLVRVAGWWWRRVSPRRSARHCLK